MRFLSLALLAIAACDKKSPSPSPADKTPDKKSEARVEAPTGWTVGGEDLTKGTSVVFGSPEIRATIKRISRSAPKGRRDWQPHVLSSDVHLANLEEQETVVSGRRAYRVHYLYREFGKPSGAPYDRHAVEACVERDATSSYEILILFSDKEAADALPQVDRFLSGLKLPE